MGPAVPADVALAGILLHRDAQLLEADELLVDATAAEHVGDGCAAVEHAGDARILRQVPEPALAQHLAAGRLQRAAEHPEQRRLAGTVAAHETDLVARHHGERGVLDDLTTTDLDRERLDLQHAAGVARRRIRLSTDQPIKALFETIGACGNPPKDDSYNFAVYAIVLLVLAWILVPAVLWFVVTHS